MFMNSVMVAAREKPRDAADLSARDLREIGDDWRWNDKDEVAEAPHISNILPSTRRMQEALRRATHQIEITGTTTIVTGKQSQSS